MMFITLFFAALLLQLLLPWWVIAPLAFTWAFYFNKTASKSFFICFAAIYCLWVAYSLYLSMLNEHILANRIGQLLGLPASRLNWIWVILLGGLPGSLVSGIAGLAGRYAKKCFY